MFTGLVMQVYINYYAIYYTTPFYARLVLEPYIAINLVDVEPVEDIEHLVLWIFWENKVANLRLTPLLACSIGASGICSLWLTSSMNAIYMNDFSRSTIYNFQLNWNSTDCTIQRTSLPSWI